MEIGGPIELAQLPRAGLTGDGNVKFCQIYGIRTGSKKRRREICAAVDGTSLDIIEIADGKTVASWPVPPDTKFECQPVSERIQLPEGGNIRRSWCAVRRRDQLFISYYEQAGRKHESNNTKTFKLDSSSAVIKLELLSAHEGGVVVLQDDGTLTFLHHEKESARTFLRLEDAGRSIKPRCMRALTLLEAQNSVLKSRPDLIQSQSNQTLVVPLVFERPSTKELVYGIWFVDSVGTVEPKLESQLVICFALNLSPSTVRKSVVDFSADLKRIQVDEHSMSTSIDIAATTPRTVSAKQPLVANQVSTLALNSDIALCLASGKLHLVNTKFDSILASAVFSPSSLKRKRDLDTSSPPTLIAYFAQLGKVITSSGGALFAIDIPSNKGLTQSSLLAGNLLRGQQAQSDNARAQNYTCAIGRSQRDVEIEDWPIISEDLDALATQKDAEGFATRFAQALDIQRSKDLNSSKIGHKQIHFLLSKIFRVAAVDDGGKERSLEVALLPMELSKWCIASGLFDTYRIAQALNLSPTTLGPKDVVQALLDFSDDIELVQFYLEHAPYLQPEILTHSISKLIQRVWSENHAMGLKTIGGSKESDATPATDIDIQLSTKATPACLTVALRRLALAGQSQVSAQLRSPVFSQDNIFTLIQFLRQQLFTGGYNRLGDSSRYPSPPASPLPLASRTNPQTQPQLSLEAIITLLNGCIDSLGTMGILATTTSAPDSLRSLTSQLLSEVSNAAQAVEDSTYLQGLVRETLRYAESVERQPFEVRAKVEKTTSQQQVEKGRIVTLYSEPDTAEAGMMPGSALPLSLKAEEDIDPFKTRRGGQVQRRSAREVGMLRDRLRSAYSFERLIL